MSGVVTRSGVPGSEILYGIPGSTVWMGVVRGSVGRVLEGFVGTVHRMGLRGLPDYLLPERVCFGQSFLTLYRKEEVYMSMVTYRYS